MAEQRHRSSEMKDFTKHQDELIHIFTRWYTQMDGFFNRENLAAAAAGLNEVHLLTEFKD